jgi:hypothetical protein
MLLTETIVRSEHFQIELSVPSKMQILHQPLVVLGIGRTGNRQVLATSSKASGRLHFSRAQYVTQWNGRPGPFRERANRHRLA